MRIFRELLFLHGHIADPVLARQLDADPPGDGDPAVPPQQAPRVVARGRRAIAGARGRCDTRAPSSR